MLTKRNAMIVSLDVRRLLSVTLDLQFSVHVDGDRAATPGKQTIKEILFSKFKLPTFSSQVMPYLNGDDLGGTERKTIFNLLSVLTTTISDRRRKRRERLRRSNYNFDLSKEEILEILKCIV
ncbi:hypothetical protein Avbf_15332 [Armadillidium vulgare]|nr:hypothetical protein Avbf_15332 [Armadillidium vulgare]